MKLLLNVSYDDKDMVKKFGAYWNPTLKKWYVTKGCDDGIWWNFKYDVDRDGKNIKNILLNTILKVLQSGYYEYYSNSLNCIFS